MSAEGHQENRYRKGELIGRGGMASVYRAYDQVAELEVALKVLHPHLSADPVAREGLRREAELLQRLDHPSILRVYGMIEIEGRPAMVMDLHEGGELRKELSLKGIYSEEEALAVALPILDALDHAHHRGVLHRDIKPHNILFDRDGRPILIDFGIGADAEGIEGGRDTQLGTVEYMAPERFDGLAIDGRSDLYSLGITLFEMVCGHLPYRGDSPAEVVRMHRDEDVADPGLFNKRLSTGFRRALRRALARHPEERFDRAGEMKAVLENGEEFRERVGVHTRWKMLTEDRDKAQAMAQVDPDEEWVVIVAGGQNWVQQLAEFQRRALREVLEAFAEYTDEAYLKRLEKRNPGIRDLVAALSVGKGLSGGSSLPGGLGFSGGEAQLEPLMQGGFARGLSRKGAEEMIRLLREKALPAVAVRREDLGWKKKIRQAMALGGLGAMGSMAAGIATVALDSVVILAAVTTPLFLGGCAAVGVLAGLTSIDGGAMGWRKALMEENFLLDFRRKTSLSESGELIGEKEADLIEQVQSPRIRASLERVMSDLLHLRDLLRDQGFNGEERLRGVLEEVRTLSGGIIENEKLLGLVEAGKTVRRIEALDRRIEREENLSVIDGLLSQKEGLRKELEARDQAQEGLESQAQQLLERASELEKILHSRDLDALRGL